jgi:hypothetical protein
MAFVAHGIAQIDDDHIQTALLHVRQQIVPQRFIEAQMGFARDVRRAEGAVVVGPTCCKR